MIKLGYALSSEEHEPGTLVANARVAERVGFEFLLISDHFHPWMPRQGQSSFVWSVLGGIAQVTQHVHIGTGVTCPLMRFHPALVAQAAATVAAMMPGRFFLGLGTGEYLNEHIFGEPWPPIDIRQDMLAEAIRIIRELWKGREYSYDGAYFTVQDARIYTLPEQPPPIYMAASGPESAQLAAEASDGLISTSSGAEGVQAFKQGGGKEKPRLGMLKVCWAHPYEEAKETVKHWWPISMISGPLHVDLPTPSHFRGGNCIFLQTHIQIVHAAHGIWLVPARRFPGGAVDVRAQCAAFTPRPYLNAESPLGIQTQQQARCSRKGWRSSGLHTG